MEWWIYFWLTDDPEEEHLVMIPSIPKLLLWIAKNGHRCCEVYIRAVEG